MFYYAYILKSLKDKKFYTGFTTNLKLRFEQHCKGESLSTKSRLPLKLVYYEACLDKKDAMHREKYLKTHYGKMFVKNRLKSYLTGGFTIIETLVAVSILVTSVTGPLSLASKGLAYSQYAKDEITAFYLANEALDVVRNIRDTNIRKSVLADQGDWLFIPNKGSDSASRPNITLVDKCGGNEGCSFDVWDNPPELQSTFFDSNEDTKIKICIKGDGSGIYYGHNFTKIGSRNCDDAGDSKEETIFSRKIYIRQVGSGALNEAKVVVVVNWTARNGLERKVVVSENLFKLGSI